MPSTRPTSRSAALAAIVGHIFPVYVGFRGGKGIATTGGAFLGLEPAAGAIAIAAFALGLDTVLVNTDLIWARGSLSPDESGLYAAASVTTSVLLLVPIGVTTVLFPRVARLRRDERGQSHLALGLLVVGALCAVGVGLVLRQPASLADWMAQLHRLLQLPEGSFTADDALTDWGLDSIRLMAIVEMARQSGLSLGFPELAQAASARDQWQRLSAKPMSQAA